MSLVTRFAPLLSALGVVMLWGCEPKTPAAEPQSTSVEAAKADDTTGAAVAPKAQERRVVILGGSLTETSFKLGQGASVVGVDLTSAWPEEANKLPKLGYIRKISAEGVLSLKPTDVLMSSDAGPPEAIAQLERAAGVKVTKLDAAQDAAGAKANIKALGEFWGRPQEATALVEALEKDLEKAAAAREQVAALGHKALFLYARGNRVLMVAGPDTPAVKLLELAGLSPAVQGFEGFKPLTPEAVLSAGPTVVVMPEQGAKSIGDLDGVFSLPGLAQAPAAKAKALLTVDDAKLLNFGPRYGEAILEVQERALKLGAAQ